jgi:hypothetical protein
MALSGLQFGMTVSFVDNGGNQVTREYMMKTEIATYVDAAAAAADMIPLVDALTGAKISQYRVFQVFQETAFTLPVDAGVQVEDRATLTFMLAGAGSKKAAINIPAPVIGVFVASSGPNANVVDTNDAAVMAFADQFLGASNFRLSDGEATTRLLAGHRTHSRSNRG